MRESMLDALTPPPRHQHTAAQPQPTEEEVVEFQEACQAVASEAVLLSQLPEWALQRPGHMTPVDLWGLAGLVGLDSVDVVKDMLETFYDLKRRCFREVLDELLSAAGPEAVDSRGRF
jgi:hypothetical protein